MLPDSVVVNDARPVSLQMQKAIASLYEKACERIYHQWAEYYDLVSWLVSAGHWCRWQHAVWHDVRGPRVLELGSGPGHVLAAGRARGFSIAGLDLSPEMAALAYRRYGQDVPYLRGDARLLPFSGSCFDTVVATFPASYALERGTLDEVRRVLTDNGLLVIVGLWVHIALGGVESLLPVFFGKPSQDRLACMVEEVAKAGFTARLQTWRDGRATVGGLVGVATTRRDTTGS